MVPFKWWSLALAGSAAWVAASGCGAAGESSTPSPGSAQDSGAGGDGGSAGSAGAAGTAGSGGMGGDGGSAGSGGSIAQSHLLGGNLSGLTGAQVVLRNNGDDLALSANGPFSFAAGLAPGAAYDVTVLEQPVNPAQLCTVSNGSGVMGQLDVTSVAVTCADVGPFTIGGVVIGLMGAGLVLQNNGGDDLSIPTGGPFTFNTPLASGATYQVTVLQQPTVPDQTCTVIYGSDAVGNANVTSVQVSCERKDSDGDHIPDIADPFPNDPSKPVVGKPNTVYAHTSSELFTMDVDSHAIASVGGFHGSGFAGQMTDIALDEFGVLYGVTFDDLYVCDATTANCFHLATLPQSFNGLTMVPRGTLDPNQDALVGIANTGDWYRIQLVGTAQAQLSKIGSYGGGYTNAGDAFSIEGVGTFAAVNKSGSGSNVIVKTDPANGNVQSELGPTSGYSSVWGLAGWQGAIFAFDSGGDVFSVDPNTAAIQVISHTSHAWWGAGVTTRL